MKALSPEQFLTRAWVVVFTATSLELPGWIERVAIPWCVENISERKDRNGHMRRGFIATNSSVIFEDYEDALLCYLAFC